MRVCACVCTVQNSYEQKPEGVGLIYSFSHDHVAYISTLSVTQSVTIEGNNTCEKVPAHKTPAVIK